MLNQTIDATVSRPQTSEQTQNKAGGKLPPQTNRWRTFWAQEKTMHHNRLMAIIIVVNIAILLFGILQNDWWTSTAINLTAISHVMLANIALAILIRQQYVINLLFKLATSAPTSWPLAIRRVLGKVYHFGGIHVAGSIVGTIWFAILAVSLLYAQWQGVATFSTATVGVTLLILTLLLSMVVTAWPSFRARYHDTFERVHRLVGWTVLGLFWAHTLLFTADQSGSLTQSPSFWVLMLVTFSVALPWLRLRRVKVDINTPSNHVALVRFNYGVTPFAGSSTAVSRNPLLEWHSFANVPSPGQDGFRLTISRAGDWTGQLIDDKPSHVWVKGIPTAGVGNIDQLFKKVVWIATGSGIGPCLPHLLAQEVPAHLVWSTRSPRETYGDGLVDEILSVQPNALIWDTNENGRPNLVELAYQAYKEFDAEAVICISNKKLTWQVVSGLESRGIPAYGAIWDS